MLTFWKFIPLNNVILFLEFSTNMVIAFGESAFVVELLWTVKDLILGPWQQFLGIIKAFYNINGEFQGRYELNWALQFLSVERRQKAPRVTVEYNQRHYKEDKKTRENWLWKTTWLRWKFRLSITQANWASAGLYNSPNTRTCMIISWTNLKIIVL